MRFASTGLFFVALRVTRQAPVLVSVTAAAMTACHADRFACGPPTLADDGQDDDVVMTPTSTAIEPAQLTELPGGILVRHDLPSVEFSGWSCLDSGWLEQIACSPGTREHESLLVIEARPSDLHAALLLAGFVPGEPGQWKYENERVEVAPPRGEALDIRVRYHGADGNEVEEPIARWIVDAEGREPFPVDALVFGGSRFAPNPDWMGPGEHYVADHTGSIIGLATFGDEVIGFAEVLSGEESVQPPVWQVNPETVPPPGTKVTVLVKRRGPV